MSDKIPAVQLPAELIGMFHLARKAFLYYETETLTWDENSLIWYRDVLFDLVQAAEAASEETRQQYVGAAMEHLAMAISDPLQLRTQEILSELERPVKWLKLFRLTHQYGGDITEANLSDIRRRIDYHLSEGRTAKSKITIAEAEKAYESFKSAYEAASAMREALLKSRKLKPPVAALLWVLSVVAAGLIGAAITWLLQLQ